MEPSENQQYVRRVILPSGRAIEVIYFEPMGDEVQANANADPVPDLNDLCLCPSCGFDLVYPFAHKEAGPDHWDVFLLCPNCDWDHELRIDDTTAQKFKRELNKSDELLLEIASDLATERFERDIDNFVQALGADAILPEDF